MRASSLLLIALLGLSGQTLAEQLASKPFESQNAEPDWYPVAGQTSESLVHWTKPPNSRLSSTATVARQVVLLIPSSMAEVQEPVRALLKREGFRLEETKGTLLYSRTQMSGANRYEEGELWWQLYLSRHPEVRQAYIDQNHAPDWQKLIAAGAIVPADLKQLNAWAMGRNRTHDIFEVQDISMANEAQRTEQPQWLASRENRSRTGGFIQTDTIRMYDVSAFLDAPFTAVILSRKDRYPNPDYKPFEFKICIMGSCGQSAWNSYDIVPQALLSRVLAALPAKTAIADTPQFWEPPPPAAPLPEFHEIRAASEPALPGEGYNWQALAIDTLPRLRPDPKTLLVLPNGDLLLGETHYTRDDANPYLTTVHRYRWTSAVPQRQTLWQSPLNSNGITLALANDGQTLWSSLRTIKTMYLQRHDLRSGETSSQALPGHAGDWQNWQLGSNQLPRFYDPIPDYTIRQMQADATFTTTLAATARAKSGVAGNLQAVHGQSAGVEWAADDWGLVAIDPESGKTLSSIALPADSKNYNPGPQALAASMAGWVARPWLRTFTDASGETRRLNGAYVVDIRQGKVLFSASIDQPGSAMSAMARSANGRLLALAQERDGKASNRIALWDVPVARSPLALQLPTGFEASDLRDLAFSPDGRYLYALGVTGVVRWSLPAALQDHARPGNLPAGI
ncbi:YncE family protein [Chitinilyticum piscinae]|uniref:WD40 repeat domain-containing protein n=1 Tax=Chitinilyticum piscinae TaxID=2866724 RepID=A0A8J7FPJ5_9NEIS|nr:hypothetical protein [Chitinilyticum piscinae]MBE9608226.1 hypothetical protein [Chitinilyticum piscinae]